MKIFLVITLLLVAVSSNAQWVQMSNGMGTDKGVYSFATIGNNIFAGTWSTGVFLSTNNGTNWTPVNNGLTNQNVNTLVASGGNLFAGTYEGVYISTNNGTSWSIVNNGLSNIIVRSLCVSGTNVFAGTGVGVYLSTNNGSSWTSVNNGLTALNMRAIAVSGINIFAGTVGGGVFLSTNNGSNWTAINNGLTSQYIYSFAVSGGNIFAGSNSGVFLSTNNGINWAEVNNGLTNLFINSLAVSGTNIFAGTQNVPSGGSIFLSTNNGINWIQKNQGINVTPIILSLLISNNYIYAGTGGTSVYRRSLSEIIGIQNISTEIPPAYSLSQNYPNPFNPTTTIKFTIPKVSSPHDLGGDLVLLKVFDVSGREVETLINEQLQPGTYSTQWNASAYSSGVYFYKIESGDFSETKRMLLIK